MFQTSLLGATEFAGNFAGSWFKTFLANCKSSLGNPSLKLMNDICPLLSRWSYRSTAFLSRSIKSLLSKHVSFSTDSRGSQYGSKYQGQFAAGILIVAQHISSDQNALDLSAELAEKFDKKIVCFKRDRLDGCIEPEHCAVVHFFQFCVDQINWLAWHYPLLSRKF